MAKEKTVKIPDAVEHTNRISHTLLNRMYNVSHSEKKSLKISNRVKHTCTLLPSNCCPGHLSQRNETYFGTETSIQTFLAVSFVIAPNWKQPRWPAVECVVKPHHAILLCNEKEQTVDTHDLDGPQGYNDEWKTASLKSSHTVWLHLYEFLKWQNYRSEEQINGWQG